MKLVNVNVKLNVSQLNKSSDYVVTQNTRVCLRMSTQPPPVVEEDSEC